MDKKRQEKALNLTRYPAVHRCFPPLCRGALPRHAARGRPVDFPGGVQVHVNRPIGGDRHRLGGLRRRYSSSPREPSPIRHTGGTLCLKTMKENPNKAAIVGGLIHYCSTNTEALLYTDRRSPSNSRPVFLKLR